MAGVVRRELAEREAVAAQRVIELAVRARDLAGQRAIGGADRDVDGAAVVERDGDHDAAIVLAEDHQRARRADGGGGGIGRRRGGIRRGGRWGG